MFFSNIHQSMYTRRLIFLLAWEINPAQSSSGPPSSKWNKLLDSTWFNFTGWKWHCRYSNTAHECSWMLSTYGLTHPLFNYCGDHECHGHSRWLIVETKVSNEWMMAGSYHTPNRSYPLGIFLEYSATVEGCSGKIFWYVAYVWNNFQQFCFQKYSGNMWASCWKNNPGICWGYLSWT